ncbi:MULTISPECIES: site-specific DNA-methyltransferase [unclassified Sphingomonas]|uniref:site-specific DNA-methyltransferase n=1 Tax=unclassified Sphingomonas TaxID=196159 RepID=UPI000E7648C3|nr:MULTISPECIES: site-specific DNA-methyltransferase [unclassified Sphingomonas]RKE45888.1 adenine-specific DNA-methyltransferase [Sphingomonas sp. PP-CC-1A-547]TCM06836.1 adenine-specific DNA-methyltransferase [Sphingomonas sp. PP-CC-3G-468]
MTIERMTLNDPEAQSADPVADNIAALKALFPAAVADSRIDFDTLRQLLGDEVEDGDERYGLNWPGKRLARRIALTPSTGALLPARKESVKWESTRNLMIEGDNLEVLKLIQKSYAESVDLIYIDPPYNTAGDFVYNDNFRDTLKDYLLQTGQIDDSGHLTSDSEGSGRYHSRWMSMIYARLIAARPLLSPTGVILVSINEIEYPRLRQILEDVFGDENHLVDFVWNNEGNVDQQSAIKGVHEYVVAFCRDRSVFSKPPVIDPNISDDSKLYNDTIENSITKNGPANPPSTVTLPEGFPALFKDGLLKPREDVWPYIIDPLEVRGGKLVSPGRVRSGWSSRNLLELYCQNGCVPIQDSEGKQTWFSLKETGAIYGFKSRSQQQSHVLSVIRNVGTTKQNSSQLQKIGVEFSYPKPVLLIQYLISVFTADKKDALVMDFFAGSGTTGEAVARQNVKDDGTRAYVLVQLPTENSRRGSADLGKAVRKRLAHTAATFASKKGTQGFRVYKLATSNLRVWQPGDNLVADLLAAADNIVQGRTEDDLLTELLLKQGIDLTEPMVTETIAGAPVHAMGGGVLVVCLARITAAGAEALADGIADWIIALNPVSAATIFFKDAGFENDVAKANVAAILDQRLDDKLLKVRSL